MTDILQIMQAAKEHKAIISHNNPVPEIIVITAANARRQAKGIYDCLQGFCELTTKCDRCGSEAEIFQVYGDYCLQCWQDRTHT